MCCTNLGSFSFWQSFEEETTERRTTQLLEEEEVVIVNNSCFTDEQRSGRNESLMIKRMKVRFNSIQSILIMIT